MKYAAHRRAIKSGDLLAWSHRGWGSWYDIKIQIVRLFTRSEYSHVGIAYVSGGRVWVLESVTPLVRMVPLSGELSCYHVPMKAKMTKGAEEYALSFVGNREYRYSQWSALLAFFGLNQRSDKAIQCCEYAKLVLASCGVDLAGNDTPTDVVNAALERGGELVYLVE